jgi:hypothetical protein
LRAFAPTDDGGTVLAGWVPKIPNSHTWTGDLFLAPLGHVHQVHSPLLHTPSPRMDVSSPSSSFTTPRPPPLRIRRSLSDSPSSSSSSSSPHHISPLTPETPDTPKE